MGGVSHWLLPEMSVSASAIEKFESEVVEIVRWNARALERKDVFLRTTIWYVASDGRKRWIDASINFIRTQTAQELLDIVISQQTAFVKSRWIRVEILRPNRDHYNDLVAGDIGDKGVLLATRTFQL